MLTTPARQSWRDVAVGVVCDTDAGEKYLDNSPGKGSSLDQCKQSCQNSAECQSITYFNSGWCSHFSTSCTNTKKSKKAASFRLIADSGPTSTQDTPTTTTAAPTTTKAAPTTTTAAPTTGATPKPAVTVGQFWLLGLVCLNRTYSSSTFHIPRALLSPQLIDTHGSSHVGGCCCWRCVRHGCGRKVPR